MHVVEATGKTIRCGLSPGRIFLQSSRDNDATGNGNDHPSCSEIRESPREILTEDASLGMERSVRPAGHLHQEDLAPFCEGSPKGMHVSSAPGHLEDSAGQALREQNDSKYIRPDVGRTSSFPLTRRPAWSPCHPSQGTPGAQVSKVMVSPHANGSPPCTSKTEEAEVMAQGNDHQQQSPSPRASPLPMISEDDGDSGRISTHGTQEMAHYSHTTSVGGMPRGGAESGHARAGELRFGRGGTQARHTPPANMTCSDATLKTFPDEKQRGGGTIFALDPSGSQDSKYKNTKSPSPHPQAELKRGERTDYLEGFQRPQGGDVRLDRRLHTTEAQGFTGTRALRTKSCVALLLVRNARVPANA